MSLINIVRPDFKLMLGNGLDNALQAVSKLSANNSSLASTSVKANASSVGNGVYQIDLTVTITTLDQNTGNITTENKNGVIAYTTGAEIGAVGPLFIADQKTVNNIANQILEVANINVRVDE